MFNIFTWLALKLNYDVRLCYYVLLNFKGTTAKIYDVRKQENCGIQSHYREFYNAKYGLFLQTRLLSQKFKKGTDPFQKAQKNPCMYGFYTLSLFSSKKGMGCISKRADKSLQSVAYFYNCIDSQTGYV